MLNWLIRLQEKVRCWTPGRVLIFLVIIQTLVWMDQFLIPGSPERIQAFIDSSISTGESTDTYYGALQSAYIVGASLSAIVTGNAVHCVTNAFNLVFVFLGVWIAAAIVSGLAANYPMLVIGRLGAGVGQAAFGCVAFPYVDDEAPGNKRASWLSFLKVAQPMGTALGFTFSSLVSRELSWRWSFQFMAIGMAPLAVMLFTFPPFRLGVLKTEKAEKEHSKRKTEPLEEEKEGHNPVASTDKGIVHVSSRERKNTVEASGSESLDDSEGEKGGLQSDPANYRSPKSKGHRPSRIPFWKEAKIVFSSPLYVLTLVGDVPLTFIAAGLGAFGSIFFKGLNIMDTEAKASILFGAIVSVTGIGGNLIGGWLTDKRFKKEAAKAGMTDVKQLLEGGGDSAASVEDEESAAFPGNAEGTEVTLQQPDVKAGPVAGVDENGLELVDLSTPKGLGRSFSQGSSKVPYQRYSPAETPAAQQEASPDAGPGAQAISRQSQKARDIALSTSLPVMAFVGMLGYACVLAVPWSADGGRFLPVIFLGVGVLLVFGTSPAASMAYLASVPPGHRAFGYGAAFVVRTVCGAVPAPILIGALIDAWAPADENGNRDTSGLQLAIFVAFLTPTITIFVWIAGAIIAIRNRRKHDREAKAGGGDGVSPVSPGRAGMYTAPAATKESGFVDSIIERHSGLGISVEEGFGSHAAHSRYPHAHHRHNSARARSASHSYQPNVHPPLGRRHSTKTYRSLAPLEQQGAPEPRKPQLAASRSQGELRGQGVGSSSRTLLRPSPPG